MAQHSTARTDAAMAAQPPADGLAPQGAARRGVAGSRPGPPFVGRQQRRGELRRAPAPPAADEMRSPRTPGGSHVPVTVSRNAAASSAQHSPTILARQDPFASPLRQQDGQQGGGNSVPRKISFDFLSPAGTVPGKAALAGEAKVGGLVRVRFGTGVWAVGVPVQVSAGLPDLPLLTASTPLCH